MADTKALCANVKMLISDVDGVLTDGSIYKGANGEELKRFSVTDGAGAAIARAAGLKLALISGRHSEATAVRAAEMKIEEVYNGTRIPRVAARRTMANAMSNRGTPRMNRGMKMGAKKKKA